MIKIRGKNQIGNLTPNHKSIKNKGQMSSNWGMLYTNGKISAKAILYFLHIVKENLIWKRYERPKFWETKNPNFGTPTWES